MNATLMASCLGTRRRRRGVLAAAVVGGMVLGGQIQAGRASGVRPVPEPRLLTTTRTASASPKAIPIATASSSLAAATPSSTPVPTVVVDAPVNGETTLARTAVVSGRAPRAVRGGDVLVEVVVNGRLFDFDGERGGRFSIPVTLALGTNTITATAEVDSSDGREQNLKSAPVVLTRQPGPTTGMLDRATALWVAEDHSSVYWLCGEADGCLAQPYCVRVSAERVDCPTKSRFQPGEPVTCGVVIAVHVTGPRLYSYAYPCKGRWREPNAFLQPAIVHTGRRYRVDEHDADWLVTEINERNQYGVPRFDVARDEFIP